MITRREAHALNLPAQVPRILVRWACIYVFRSIVFEVITRLTSTVVVTSTCTTLILCGHNNLTHSGSNSTPSDSWPSLPIFDESIDTYHCASPNLECKRRADGNRCQSMMVSLEILARWPWDCTSGRVLSGWREMTLETRREITTNSPHSTVSSGPPRVPNPRLLDSCQRCFTSWKHRQNRWRTLEMVPWWW